jgi:uncharacterized protein
MRTLFLLILVLLTTGINAQHKIVYDLGSSDTSAYSAVLRQINNVKKSEPGALIEVVVHGEAIAYLTKTQCPNTQGTTERAKLPGVEFTACQNSLNRKKIDKSELLPIVRVVPVAILELADKQQQGWSYIKAGH